MLSRISFHVLYGRPFKTLCFLNYALMIRQDYDITSSLRRGALHQSYRDDNDSPREKIDIVTNMDELLPPRFDADDLEEEVDVVDDLHVDSSVSNFENELFDSEASDFDNPSFPRPPLKPPDADADFELDAGEEISVVMNDKLECLDPRDEYNENDDYFPFMFVIRIFLPYLICSKMFLSFFSAESEDTIFDPGISV
nr:hypothetical protein [Tanacetum cinerariifolium]